MITGALFSSVKLIDAGPIVTRGTRNKKIKNLSGAALKGLSLLLALGLAMTLAGATTMWLQVPQC